MNDSPEAAHAPQPALPLARYRVRFREHVPRGGFSLTSPRTGYLGSAWRGAFGHALRKTVCVTRLPSCDPCVLLRSCPYPFLFESRTPPGARKLTRYPRTPGPFVLEPADRHFDTEDGTLNLGVTLFGSAKVIYTPHPHNRPDDTRDAEVTLAIIPFVRLRDELPEALLDREVRFDDAVSAAQRAIGPTELVIDLAERRLRAGGKVIRLSPLHLAFFAWLARRQMRGSEWLACPSQDASDPHHAEAFLAEYRTILGEMGDDERTAGRLRDEGGMTREFFSQTKSKLHRSLRDRLGRRHARPYPASEEGSRPRRRCGLGLDIDPQTIRFEPIEARVAARPAGGNLAVRSLRKDEGVACPADTGRRDEAATPEAMADRVNKHDSGGALLDATCRLALAGLLHDLGKLAERADMPIPNREILETNKQIYWGTGAPRLRRVTPMLAPASRRSTSCRRR